MVDNQIAVVTTSQTFENNMGWPFFPKYAFPVPPDSTPPGPGEDWDEDLLEYMGPRLGFST